MSNEKDLERGVEEKKKQKAGLGGVRPSDFFENTFKDMAAEQNLSQTDMFERIMLSYLRNERNEKRNLALNLESDVNLIAKDLNNISMHFKNIVEKSQEAMLQVTANKEQTEKNLNLEIDTLRKKNEELEKRNHELEQSNSVFTEVKEGLDNKIAHLNELQHKKDEELVHLKASLKEKDNQIKELEKQNKILEKELQGVLKDTEKLNADNTTKDIRIKNLETTNASLQAAVENMESLKKAELASIEAHHKSQISLLEDKLQAAHASSLQALESMEANYKTKVSQFEDKISSYQEASAESKATIEELQKEISNLTGKLENHITKERNLEATNKSLQSIIDNMESLKKSEIASIMARTQSEVSGLEVKLKTIKDELQMKFEAEKKIALAEMKLELAVIKSSYAEALTEINQLKNASK